jgi:hypothetical protein
MKKLYTVTCEFVYVVVADNEKQAKTVACNTAPEAFRDQSWSEMNWMITEGMHADGWEDDSVPYGGSEYKTVGEYLEG